MKDPEFGDILFRVNARSKGFTFRPSEGALLVTVPPRASEREVIESIERMRPRLRQMMERYRKQQAGKAQRCIDWNFRIQTESFGFSLLADPTLKTGSYRIRKEMGNVTLLCPPDTDFQAEGRQEWLTKVVEEQVRSYAKGLLPARLRELSRQFDLPVKEVHINAARGRWGSCVGHKQRSFLRTTTEYTINLSLFTLLLPPHLQRLILLHELTHTLEMNHSERFHQKLDAMLGGTEKQLEKELKKYKTDIFSFANIP